MAKLRVSRLVVLATCTLAWPVSGQGRLSGYSNSAVGPVYEHWSFGDGIHQPSSGGSDSVLLESASQFSIPLAVTVPLGTNVSVDLATAYATGRVSLADGADYRLSGLTDVRLRASGRVTESVILTVGFNLPSGQNELDEEEFEATRVLAAPALSFQVPTLGSGFSGTAGVVLARQLGGWAWALGTSYEARGGYSPGVVAGGIFVDEFNPSDAFRISLGADGLVGASAMTFAVSADLFTEDRLTSDQFGGGGTAEGFATELGPIFSFDWQLRLATSRFRELAFYAVDRYRTKYKRDSESIEGSSGNYLDLGVRGLLPVSPSTSVLGNVNFRHQTGLSVDDAISTAAMAGGAVTLGLEHTVHRVYSLRPFVRGQFGRLKSGERSTDVAAFAGGVTFGLRF